MNLNEYQIQAMRTSPDGHDRVNNGLLGMIGECGEVVDLVKKWKYQSGESPVLPTEKLIKECGDILWYCSEYASGIGENLEDMLESQPVAFTKFGHNIETVSVAMAKDAATAYFELPSRRLRYVRLLYAHLKYLCELIDTTIEHIADVNIAKLRKRYPDGFDPERSIHRPEYERAEKPINIGGSSSAFLFEMRNKAI